MLHLLDKIKKKRTHKCRMMDVHTNQWIFNHVDFKTKPENLFQARDDVKAFAQLFIFQLTFLYFSI